MSWGSGRAVQNGRAKPAPLLRSRRYENGFSLVETLAALLVFAIITLGLIPLLAGSIRGSDISRKGTAGKQLVTEAMERVRGLPFYIDYNTQARKVDVLDLYFPTRSPTFSPGVCTGYLNAGSVTCTSTNYTATGPSFVTTCPDAANMACPQDLPTGYTLTYETAFVLPTATTPETYTKSEPLTTYAYNSSGNDRGPRLIVEMVITGRWQSTGRGARTYQARTLLSDRRFSGLKILGEATIDYAVQFIGQYSRQGGVAPAELTITGGAANSRIEIRRTATASSTMTAGEMALVNLDNVGDTDETNDYFDGPLTGATASLVAPPDANVNPSSVGEQTADHANASHGPVVGGMDQTDGDSVAAAVTTSNLPTAGADFDYSPSNNTNDLWVSHKRDDNDLELEDADDWVARVVTKASTTLQGATTATTNALGTQPGVTTSATVSFKQLQVFLTDDSDDIEDEDGIDDNIDFDGAILAISGPRDGSGNPSGVFSATATCNADNDGTQATPAATATYEGTLWYWRDITNNNDPDDGQYEWVDLATGNSSQFGAGTNVSTTLENIQSGSPIRVIDQNPDTRDVYLFSNGTNPNYLTDWSANAGATTSITNNGRNTSARLEKALAIETAELERNEPDTALAIALGAVSCRAEDNR